MTATSEDSCIWSLTSVMDTCIEGKKKYRRRLKMMPMDESCTGMIGRRLFLRKKIGPQQRLGGSLLLSELASCDLSCLLHMSWCEGTTRRFLVIAADKEHMSSCIDSKGSLLGPAEINVLTVKHYGIEREQLNGM